MPEGDRDREREEERARQDSSQAGTYVVPKSSQGRVCVWGGREREVGGVTAASVGMNLWHNI